MVKEHIDIIQAVRSYNTLDGKPHPAGALPNMDGARIPLKNPPIDPTPWENILGTYFNRNRLTQAFKYGWDMSILPNPDPRDSSKNHQSAYDHPDTVRQYIQEELSYGTLIGPVPKNLPFYLPRSPLATVEKPGYPGKRRCVTDCSQRRDGELHGINNWIPAQAHRGEEYKIHLPRVQEIVQCIEFCKKKYPGSRIVMFKYDFSRFYRQLYVDPGQTIYLVIEWEGNIYIDRVFSFGNRGACMEAQSTSDAVCWVYRTQLQPAPDRPNSGLACRCRGPCLCGDNFGVAYVDDCICVCPEEHSQFLFEQFGNMAKSLTLKLSQTAGHICPPSPQCTALGILFNLDTNTISLPADKLEKIADLVHSWLQRKTALRKDLDSLCGKLLHAAGVVPPGRLHLARMLETKRRADKNPGPVVLDKDFHLDLEWWDRCLTGWNGTSYIQFNNHGDIAVDASSRGWLGSSPGIGGYNYSNNTYFATGVPATMQRWDICDLELLAILIAHRLWGDDWLGCRVGMLTDNEATRLFINNGKSRSPLRLQMGRLITQVQFKKHFRIEIDRISTSDNKLADYLSRSGEPGMVDSFNSIVSGFGVSPVRLQVPDSMFSLQL